MAACRRPLADARRGRRCRERSVRQQQAILNTCRCDALGGDVETVGESVTTSPLIAMSSVGMREPAMRAKVNDFRLRTGEQYRYSRLHGERHVQVDSPIWRVTVDSSARSCSAPRVADTVIAVIAISTRMSSIVLRSGVVKESRIGVTSCGSCRRCRRDHQRGSVLAEGAGAADMSPAAIPRRASGSVTSSATAIGQTYRSRGLPTRGSTLQWRVAAASCRTGTGHSSRDDFLMRP